MAKADYQNVRARRRERAEPERACMMWYRAVAHVSLYFFCLYSLSLPLVSAASALPSIRPSVRSALPPSAASREFRITPTSVRGSTGTDPPTDRLAAAALRWSSALAASVRFRVVWLHFRHHFVFRLPSPPDCSPGRRPTSESARVSNYFPYDSRLRPAYGTCLKR